VLGLAHDREVFEFRDETTGRISHCAAQPTIATDGAGSAVRDSLVAREVASVREEPLDHDYKQLTIPARDGKHVMDPNALHIWPRGGFMLIALPNLDGTFTATLFLARVGANSFEQLRNAGDVDGFFAREFPSARALIPGLTREWFEHPQGSLGTVYTRGWHMDGNVLLLGDAAHAIVPFHGQGMNCAFEDCAELMRMMDEHHHWSGCSRRSSTREGRTPMRSRRWRWRTTSRCARRCWTRITAARRRKPRSARSRIRTSSRAIPW
jgi:kynurenine 3-monooxygenase